MKLYILFPYIEFIDILIEDFMYQNLLVDKKQTKSNYNYCKKTQDSFGTLHFYDSFLWLNFVYGGLQVYL